MLTLAPFYMKPVFAKLPTLQDRPRLAQPKKATKLADKTAEKREDEKQLAAMRRAVWARDKGQCQKCKRKVVQTLSLVPERGEVHHKRGRRVAPEDRYDPKKCVLLCASCHTKITRHEVKL
jgi:5-methylcytosine-specific restriction endonuclease McrA